jgi:pimeloyl-ACP methyl ester carboxylesterase
MSTEEDEGVHVRLAAARAKGERCTGRSEREDDIRRRETTAYVTRNIMETLKRLPGQFPYPPSLSVNLPVKDMISKLNFLGLAYGTGVGQTFASMYPEHVSRVVFDGSGDRKPWTDKGQLQHIIDRDAVWASFHSDCFEAKGACPL